MVSAQDFPKADASIMDISYFPRRATMAAFAKSDEQRKSLAKKARVIYSRPAMKGREIFGELVPYEEVWRIGANESTEIMFFEDATVNGVTLPAGTRYTLHALPTDGEWTIYFSSDVDAWGSYAFKPEETTVAEITVPTQKTDENLELLGIYFEPTDEGAHMIIGWADTMVKVPISFE